MAKLPLQVLSDCRQEASSLGMRIARSMALSVGVVDRSGQLKLTIWTIHGHYQAFRRNGRSCFFADSDTSIGLRVSQMPRCSKVAFFVLTTTDNDDRQNRLLDPSRMRAGVTNNNVSYYIATAVESNMRVV